MRFEIDEMITHMNIGINKIGIDSIRNVTIDATIDSTRIAIRNVTINATYWVTFFTTRDAINITTDEPIREFLIDI